MTTTTTPAARRPVNVHPSTIRLARAVVRSAERDGEPVDGYIRRVAKLPLPEDGRQVEDAGTPSTTR